MATIQWRPEVNPLTVPQSYKLRFLPREVIGLDDIAAEIEAENPTYNRALVKAIISAFMRKMQQSLINGKQVTIEDAVTFTLSFLGRLDAADETPTDLSEMLQVKATPRSLWSRRCAMLPSLSGCLYLLRKHPCLLLPRILVSS